MLGLLVMDAVPQPQVRPGGWAVPPAGCGPPRAPLLHAPCAALARSRALAPQDHFGFRPAWRACPSATALKHLDVVRPGVGEGGLPQRCCRLATKRRHRGRRRASSPGAALSRSAGRLAEHAAPPPLHLGPPARLPSRRTPPACSGGCMSKTSRVGGCGPLESAACCRAVRALRHRCPPGVPTHLPCPAALPTPRPVGRQAGAVHQRRLPARGLCGLEEVAGRAALR